MKRRTFLKGAAGVALVPFVGLPEEKPRVRVDFKDKLIIIDGHGKLTSREIFAQLSELWGP